MPTGNDIEIGWRTQLSTEYRLWQIDLSPELDNGDLINAVSATLVDLLDGSAYATGLAAAATFNGTTVTQAVHSLVAGKNYRLVLTANVGSSKLTSTVLLLRCTY